MDTSSSAFSYYRDPNAAQMPIVFDKRYGHIFSFGHVAPKGGREDLLPLNKHVRYKRHLRWSPKMVEGPVPSDTHVLHKLHLLSAPFVPTIWAISHGRKHFHCTWGWRNWAFTRMRSRR